MVRSVPLYCLARILGHNSLGTTKWYVQGMKHDVQQVIEILAWR